MGLRRILAGTIVLAIWQIERLQATFFDLPFLRAPSTPMLLPWTTIFVSWNPAETIHSSISSITMVSSQPMSWLATLQPSKGFQAAQQPLTTKPMPHDVEASTQTSGFKCRGGKRDHAMCDFDNTAAHQRRSICTSRMA